MDIESQSCANLRTVGSRAYIRDKTTRLMSAVFYADGQLHVWVPQGPNFLLEKYKDFHGTVTFGNLPPDEILNLSNRCWVAHNAEGFDAPFWRHHVGWSPSAWQDTIHTVRQHGLPGSLDKAGQALFGRGKDKAGSNAMKLLTVAKVVRGEPVYPVGTLPLWQEMLDYNIQDVLLLRDLYYALPVKEPELLNRDWQINQRGIYVDLDFARKLKDTWNEFKKESGDDAAKATKGELTADDLRSPAKVKAWLRKQGFSIESLARNTVQEILDDPDSILGDSDNPQAVLAVEVLKRRMDATRSSSAKIEGLLEDTDADGRLRGVYVYHKAHTGRWSSRGVQLHNLPRGLAKLPVERLRSDLALSAMKEATSKVSDAFTTLIRPCFGAAPGKRLCIADFAGVEARGIAWVAREDVALQVFQDPKQDIYCQFGSVVYGRPITKKDKTERQVSKVVVLGCGYGMGHNKFAITAKNQGVDLEAAGVTPEQLVKLYRSTYPRIPAVWRSYQQAAHRAVTERVASVAGRCGFGMDGGSLVIELPSGRLLTYRNARMGKKVPPWGGPPIDALFYDSPEFSGKDLYGGKIAENVVQAICRDVMAHSLLQLEDTVIHVHDEIGIEVDEDLANDRLDHMLKVMSTPPVWAKDFPILVEGFVSPHYVKEAYPGSYERKQGCGTKRR